MNLNHIDPTLLISVQFLALVSNAIALNLVCYKDFLNEEKKKYAFLFGLIAQPIWLMIFIHTGNYLMLAFCILNTVGWIRGFYNYWFSNSN